MTRKAVETGALWKPWKNGDIKQTTLGVEFFHRSHNAWETPPDGVSHRSHRFYDEIHPPKNETPRLQKCNLMCPGEIVTYESGATPRTSVVPVTLVFLIRGAALGSSE